MSTYAEWAETHESDIYGDGWGSDHLWHYEATPSTASVYKCARCFWPFAHYYNNESNIFKAMKSSGVPDKCSRKQLWPIRPEYAKKEELQHYEQERAAISKATE